MVSIGIWYDIQIVDESKASAPLVALPQMPTPKDMSIPDRVWALTNPVLLPTCRSGGVLLYAAG